MGILGGFASETSNIKPLENDIHIFETTLEIYNLSRDFYPGTM